MRNQTVVSSQVNEVVKGSDLRGVMFSAKELYSSSLWLQGRATFLKVKLVSEALARFSWSTLAFSAPKALSTTVTLNTLTSLCLLRKAPSVRQNSISSQIIGETNFFQQTQYMNMTGTMSTLTKIIHRATNHDLPSLVGSPLTQMLAWTIVQDCPGTLGAFTKSAVYIGISPQESRDFIWISENQSCVVDPEPMLRGSLILLITKFCGPCRVYTPSTIPSLRFSIVGRQSAQVLQGKNLVGQTISFSSGLLSIIKQCVINDTQPLKIRLLLLLQYLCYRQILFPKSVTLSQLLQYQLKQKRRFQHQNHKVMAALPQLILHYLSKQSETVQESSVVFISTIIQKSVSIKLQDKAKFLRKRWTISSTKGFWEPNKTKTFIDLQGRLQQRVLNAAM